jgi:hypothetical protein
LDKKKPSAKADGLFVSFIYRRGKLEAGLTLLAGAIHGLVNAKAATLELLSVKRANGVLGLVIISHLDETEAASLAGLAISDDGGGNYFAILSEKTAKAFRRGPVIEVTDVNFLSHSKKLLVFLIQLSFDLNSLGIAKRKDKGRTRKRNKTRKSVFLFLIYKN